MVTEDDCTEIQENREVESNTGKIVGDKKGLGREELDQGRISKNHQAWTGQTQISLKRNRNEKGGIGWELRVNAMNTPRL